MELGWIEERVQPSSYQVEIHTHNISTSVNLPSVGHVDSLASSLWPASLAAAILAQSPAFHGLESVAELGCGLGLFGLAMAGRATRCLLTDNDEEAVDALQRLVAENPAFPQVQVAQLDWRDTPDTDDKFQAVIGADIAYYYHLLRPMMDTTRRLAYDHRSLSLFVGQANRESQWELYHNIRDGCYNQLTDEREPPWPGTVSMLLYRLSIGKWSSGHDDDEAGVIAMAAVLYQSPGCHLEPLTDYDYVACQEDEEKMMMSF